MYPQGVTRTVKGGPMSEDRKDQESALRTGGPAQKRPWHRPDLREVDVIETQAGTGTYTAGDFSTYGS